MLEWRYVWKEKEVVNDLEIKIFENIKKRRRRKVGAWGEEKGRMWGVGARAWTCGPPHHLLQPPLPNRSFIIPSFQITLFKQITLTHSFLFSFFFYFFISMCTKMVALIHQFWKTKRNPCPKPVSFSVSPIPLIFFV